MTCEACGQTLEPGARFCSACGRPVTAAATNPPYGTGRLVRPRNGRIIAGVCAGFALHYGWDVIIVRLILVLSMLFAGTPILAYIVAWILMPNEQWSLPAQTGPGPVA